MAEEAFLDTVRAHRPDVLLSFFWPKKIPAAVLRACPQGAFGTHPSLLPALRGPDPYFWAIRQGHRESGVTLHRLEPEYDTGAIVAQRRISLTDEMDSWALAKALDRPAIELLCDAAQQLTTGPLEERLQPDGATWAPRPSTDDLRIDWKRPADELLRLIRAAAPEPGAQALLGDRPVEIVRACRSEGGPVGLLPAEAWRDSAGWHIRCGEGAIRLLSVRDTEGEPIRIDEIFAP